jgi:hypothetical protein
MQKILKNAKKMKKIQSISIVFFAFDIVLFRSFRALVWEPLELVKVRFLVVHGQPGARLVDCVVHPQAVLAAGGRLQLNGQYYITKQLIPALDRLFSLLGVDVSAWYTLMTRPLRLLPHKRPLASLPIRTSRIVGKGNSFHSARCVCPQMRSFYTLFTKTRVSCKGSARPLVGCLSFSVSSQKCRVSFFYRQVTLAMHCLYASAPPFAICLKSHVACSVL